MLTAVAVAGIAFIAPAMSDSGNDAGGELVASPKRIELGLFRPGEVKTDTLYLKNIGNAPVAITRISSDCGCTAAKAAGDIVVPHDSIPVVISFDAGRRLPGEFRKVVRVRSTSRTGTLVIVVSGKVVRPTVK